MDEVIVSVNDLSHICGIGNRQIQNLAKEGVFVREGKGGYLLVESLKNFIAFRGGSDEGEGVDEEKFLEAKAKREIAEIRAALMKGRVVETEAVMYVVGEIFTLVRNRVLALPDRLVPEIVRPDEVVAAKELMGKMVREILSELAVSGDAITEQTDFKRVSAPACPSDVGLSFSAGEDLTE